MKVRQELVLGQNNNITLFKPHVQDLWQVSRKPINISGPCYFVNIRLCIIWGYIPYHFPFLKKVGEMSPFVKERESTTSKTGA